MTDASVWMIPRRQKSHNIKFWMPEANNAGKKMNSTVTECFADLFIGNVTHSTWPPDKRPDITWFWKTWNVLYVTF